jgi:hypothetical protein
MLAHLKANLVAYAALFVALGGTSYAAVRLPAGSVGTKELRSEAVTRVKLHRAAVTSRSVRDHALREIDFAPGVLIAGAKGDQGPKGDAGQKGDPGPTLGVAGTDTGCCVPLALGSNLPSYATKKVTITTRSRLFVFGNVWSRIDSCSSVFCYIVWGLVVDGVAVPHATRRVETLVGEPEADSLTPFGVTEPLDPGEHTVALVRDTPAGTLTSSFGDAHLGAIALGV